MKLNITDNTVIVKYDSTSYQFNRYDNDRLEPVTENIPHDVKREVKKRGFFIQTYPTTFTWKFSSKMYDFDEVLYDVPDDIIKSGSREHQSLYNLVAGKYSGVTMEVTVGDDGFCRFTNIINDLPIKGSYNNRYSPDV